MKGEKKMVLNSTHLYYVVLFALPKGPEPLAQGHGFSNLGRRLYEQHNHAFNSSPSAVDVENIF